MQRFKGLCGATLAVSLLARVRVQLLLGHHMCDAYQRPTLMAHSIPCYAGFEKFYPKGKQRRNESNNGKGKVCSLPGMPCQATSSLLVVEPSAVPLAQYRLHSNCVDCYPSIS